MSLLANLISHLKLDEATGLTRVDSHSTHDFQNVGPPDVPQAAGKIGNAAGPFTTVGQSLFRTTDVDYSPGAGDFGTAFWFLIGDSTKNLDVANDSGSWGVRVINGIATGTVSSLSPPGSASVSVGSLSQFTWHYLAFWYDHGLQKIYLTIDDGTIASADSVSPAGLAVGANTALFGQTGLVDSFDFWKGGFPTAAGWTFAYNNGAGRPFSEYGDFGFVLPVDSPVFAAPSRRVPIYQPGRISPVIG